MVYFSKFFYWTQKFKFYVCTYIYDYKWSRTYMVLLLNCLMFTNSFLHFEVTIFLNKVLMLNFLVSLLYL